MLDDLDKKLPINISTIMKFIPHRYPFLLIDRIIELDIEKKLIKGIKNVTINEQFFIGHFPNFPVMPGVLIIESLAQMAGMLATFLTEERKKNELYFFVGIDHARFKRQVIPGDTLIFHIELIRLLKNTGKYAAIATVNDEIVAEAELMIMKKKVENYGD